MSRPDLYPHELEQWERTARKTRKVIDPQVTRWDRLLLAVLGVGIGGGAILHVIGRYVA